MTRWFRYYEETLHDPKVLRLSDSMFRAWVNVLCLASKYGGAIPREDIATIFRISDKGAAAIVEYLIDRDLLEDRGDFVTPHNWDGRQYKSDKSNDRVKRYRERKGNVTCNVTETVTVTPPDTETETDTDKNAPSGASGPYFFESGTIRLSEKDFRKWKDAFSNLDLKAELIGLTKWAGEQRDWYFAVAGALAKRNRELALARASPGSPKKLSKREEIYREGIV